MKTLELICLFIFIFVIKIESFNSISEITMTIKGEGNQLILSNEKNYETDSIFNEPPDEVKINDIIQDISSDNKYYLSKEVNTIKMKWINNLVRNCDNMLYKLSNITFIDFSKFDSSEVTSANLMFSECISIKYINFTGFNTSKITSMNKVFNGCSSLEFLDLIYFDTSRVVDMKYLFCKCYSLQYIDLKSFDTSLVTEMNNINIIYSDKLKNDFSKILENIKKQMNIFL